MSRDVTNLPPPAEAETASTNGDNGSSGASTSKLEDRQRPSQSTLAGPTLPDGCAYGTLAKVDGDGKEAETVIWVEFAPGSRDNPFFFSKWRKVSITACATFFTFMTGEWRGVEGVKGRGGRREAAPSSAHGQASSTNRPAYTTTAYSISEESMCRDLGCNNLQFASGIALYAWGFGIAPLMLAPLSEEFGRRWTYATACFLFFILHLMMSL